MAQRQIDDLASHPHRHVTVPALARYWHVHPRTVHKWIDAGLLPVVRLPNDVVRISVTVALRFEERHTCTSAHLT